MSSRHAAALERAGVLVEALPWLERFHGAPSSSSSAATPWTDDALQRAFAEDVVFLRYAGLRPVVVHGGGPQITAHLDRLGIESVFAAGHRCHAPRRWTSCAWCSSGRCSARSSG
jgi:acetylglutamate kinase